LLQNWISVATDRKYSDGTRQHKAINGLIDAADLHESAEHVDCSMTDSIVIALQSTHDFDTNLLTHSTTQHS